MTKPQKIAVLLADDHEMLLDLWASVLSLDKRFEVCGKAASSTIAVQIARAKRPDVLIMDINIGPVDGFEATRLIRSFSPMTKIIGMSVSIFPAYMLKMRSLGAMGYVTKNSSADEMIHAILEANQGNFYCCKQIETIMKAEEKMYGSKKTVKTSLTLREIEVAQLIVSGLRSKEIGKRLDVSPKTINIHRNNIFRKLNVNSLAGLIQKANEVGL